jgi:predicted AlkP superfamily phosphohydrolase/phosphomutase
MKTIVIGLDGTGFELNDPWVEKGDLPNIAKLKQQGVREIHSLTYFCNH